MNLRMKNTFQINENVLNFRAKFMNSNLVVNCQWVLACVNASGVTDHQWCFLTERL